MGDVTSTCCKNTTHDLEANITREVPTTERLLTPRQPFKPASSQIIQTFKEALSTQYFNCPQLSLSDPQAKTTVFGSEDIITLTRKTKNKEEKRSIFDFVSGDYHLYIKSLSENDQINMNEEIFTGLFLIYFPSNNYFLGNLKRNQPTGGVFIFKPFCYYVGSIDDLHAQGQGKYSNQQNGYRYEGNWSKNLQHGQGKEFYANGDTFIGEFMYGGKFGEGVYNFNNGKQYSGYFYNGKSDGMGTLKISEKEWYKGEWKLDCIQGKGEYHYGNGDIYIGQFQNGVKSGEGKYKFAAGYEYEGGWLEGKMHGYGVIRQGYDQIQGYWQNGRKIQ